jgi:hypothetical protein
MITFDPVEIISAVELPDLLSRIGMFCCIERRMRLFGLCREGTPSSAKVRPLRSCEK